MHVLGLKIEGHDPGAALIDGTRVVAIAEERLNRKKHSQGIFPSLSIDYCLRTLNVKDDQIDLIVIDHTSRESGRNIERIFRNTMGDRFQKTRIEIISHHDAHAASAFFCSPFDEAAILVYDGRGSMVATEFGTTLVETESLMRGSGTTITPIDKWNHSRRKEMAVPRITGIGMFYDRMCVDYVSLGKHNHGKMMGLAAYGTDTLLKQFPMERWIAEVNGEIVVNGDIQLQPYPGSWKRRGIVAAMLTLREYVAGALRITLRALMRQESLRVFEPITLSQSRNPKTVTLPDEHYSAAAYAAQKIFEQFAIMVGRRLKDVTRSENLCVSGGCALNIDANRNFLTEVGFKNLFVQPASSDCGIALGCALWGYHITLKQPRFWEMKSASLGRPYTHDEIDADIAKFGDKISSRKSKHIAKEVAQLLAENNIIGWFQGGSEYGPRALGNRSILANAGNKDMRDILNKRVKHREMWRPFAASILLERLSDWFDLDTKTSATAFMLLAAEVHEEKRGSVPSIVHVDNTCRMQSLTREDNGVYYDMVKEFEALTGIPLVLNTSFNLGGDPIVETPYDAIDTFLRTDMDYLVLGDRIVQKKS